MLLRTPHWPHVAVRVLYRLRHERHADRGDWRTERVRVAPGFATRTCARDRAVLCTGRSAADCGRGRGPGRHAGKVCAADRAADCLRVGISAVLWGTGAAACLA